MDDHDAHPFFAQARDTGEIVFAGPPTSEPTGDPAYGMWRSAHADAEDAWSWWRDTGDTSAFLAYQAALDREDAAQNLLASALRDASP